MIRNLVCVFFLFVVEIGCGNPQSDYNDEIENAKLEQDTKVTSLKKDTDSCFAKDIRDQNTTLSAKLQTTYNQLIESTRYIDSLRRRMNNLNTLDVSNMEIVKQEFKYQGLFDSVLKKTSNVYQLIKETTYNDKRKSDIDSVVNELNGKFRDETFDAWPPIAMSSILFDIESNLLSYSNSCFEMK
jgi:uncharacterized coiled-coil DUF342 family protein